MIQYKLRNYLGNWYYFKDYNNTDFNYIDTDFTGVAQNEYGFWVVEKGYIKIVSTEEEKKDIVDGWYVTNTWKGLSESERSRYLKVDFNFSGIKRIDNKDYIIKQGKVDKSFYGYVDSNYFGYGGIPHFFSAGVSNEIKNLVYPHFDFDENKFQFFLGSKKAKTTTDSSATVAFDINNIAYSIDNNEQTNVKGIIGSYCFENGKQNLNYSEYYIDANSEFKQYFSQGKKDNSYEGIAKSNNSLFYISNGVEHEYNGLIEFDGKTYLFENSVNPEKASVDGYISKEIDGIRYLFYAEQNNYYTLCDNFTGIIKDKTSTVSSFPSFVNNVSSYDDDDASNSMHPVYCYKNGIFDNSFSGVLQEPNTKEWFKITKGQRDFEFTELGKNQYGWWHFDRGRCFFSTVASTSTTNPSSSYRYIGVSKNEYGWWYLDGYSHVTSNKNDGGIDYSKSGLCPAPAFGHITEVRRESSEELMFYCYIKDGKMDVNYTGACANEHGIWYVEQGAMKRDKSQYLVKIPYLKIDNKEYINQWFLMTNNEIIHSSTISEEEMIAENQYGIWLLREIPFSEIEYFATKNKIITKQTSGASTFKPNNSRLYTVDFASTFSGTKILHGKSYMFGNGQIVNSFYETEENIVTTESEPIILNSNEYAVKYREDENNNKYDIYTFQIKDLEEEDISLPVSFKHSFDNDNNHVNKIYIKGKETFFSNEPYLLTALSYYEDHNLSILPTLITGYGDSIAIDQIKNSHEGLKAIILSLNNISKVITNGTEFPCNNIVNFKFSKNNTGKYCMDFSKDEVIDNKPYIKGVYVDHCTGIFYDKDNNKIYPVIKGEIVTNIPDDLYYKYYFNLKQYTNEEDTTEISNPISAILNPIPTILKKEEENKYTDITSIGALFDTVSDDYCKVAIINNLPEFNINYNNISKNSYIIISSNSKKIYYGDLDNNNEELLWSSN